MNFQSSKQNLSSVVYLSASSPSTLLLGLLSYWELAGAEVCFLATRISKCLLSKFSDTYEKSNKLFRIFFKMSKLSDLIPFLTFSFYFFWNVKLISMSFSTSVFDKFSIRQLNTFLVLSSKYWFVLRKTTDQSLWESLVNSFDRKVLP